MMRGEQHSNVLVKTYLDARAIDLVYSRSRQRPHSCPTVSSRCVRQVTFCDDRFVPYTFVSADIHQHRLRQHIVTIVVANPSTRQANPMTISTAASVLLVVVCLSVTASMAAEKPMFTSSQLLTLAKVRAFYPTLHGTPVTELVFQCLCQCADWHVPVFNLHIYPTPSQAQPKQAFSLWATQHKRKYATAESSEVLTHVLIMHIITCFSSSFFIQVNAHTYVYTSLGSIMNQARVRSNSHGSIMKQSRVPGAACCAWRRHFPCPKPSFCLHQTGG